MPTPGRDLVALGISRTRIASAVRTGQLVRVRRGVFLAAGRWPDEPVARHLLRAAAEQSVLVAGAISHRSAALHWELPLPTVDWATEPVWLTLPSGGGFRSECAERIRLVVAPLPTHQRLVAPAGYRMTTLARTAVDVARDLPLPEALMVLDAALRRETAGLLAQVRRRDLANPRLVAAARAPLAEVASSLPRMRGVRRALPLAHPARESAIESLSFGHMVLAGLPLPDCQFPIATPMGTLYPDFYWEQANLIGEADGRIKYADSAAIIREKEREQVLRDQGFRIVRWLGKEIHLTPGLVMARIARALGQ